MSTAPPVTSLTPMMRQYLEVKAQHPDALLMYRMGDFFEMFFDDARQAAPILEVQLTARQKGTENETAMCGVPHHALETYLAKLLGAGLKVAICDQVEDPAQAKGLVKREVTRVVTPGTLSDPGLLEGKEENFLAALVWEREEGAGAFLDLSTGSFFVRRWRSPEEAVEDLALMRPREVLFHSAGRTAFRPRSPSGPSASARAARPWPATGCSIPGGPASCSCASSARAPCAASAWTRGSPPSAPPPRPWPTPRRPRRAASRTSAASPCARRGTG